jgi:hypothetical protein
MMKSTKMSTSRRLAVITAAAAVLAIPLTLATPAHAADDSTNVVAGEARAPKNVKATDLSGSTSVTPAVVNDANITYKKGSKGKSSLTVCKNWGASTCDTSWLGLLSNGQNTKTTLGWTDADGYQNPSGCTTKASYWAGPLIVEYTFPNPGWIKLSGLNGGTWTVTMTC